MAKKDRHVDWYLKCSYSPGFHPAQMHIFLRDPNNKEGRAVFPDGSTFPPEKTRMCVMPKRNLAKRTRQKEGLVRVEGPMKINDLEGTAVMQLVDIEGGGFCRINIPQSEIVVRYEGKFHPYSEVRDQITLSRDY